jgi:hypothetical protein
MRPAFATPERLAIIGPVVVLAALGAAQPAASVELEGTWYVLVHYQDKESNKPDAWRWEDRVWRFTRAGDNLEWTEWPIVVFEDESGRFDSLGGNRASRVVAAWEPTPAQLADIQDGLQVNSRGTKTKTLRAGDGGSAWESSEGGAAESASIITYSEHWSIGGLPEKPVFSREDSLGSARSETMEGRTEYRTEEVRDGGRELVGVFERDGTRAGRFRMIASGETEAARGSGLTQGQRALQMLASQAGLNLNAEQIKALSEGRVVPGVPIPDETRQDVRKEIRRNVEDAVRQQGGDPRAAQPQVDALVDRIERLILDEGKTVEEVQRMLQAGEIRP